MTILYVLGSGVAVVLGIDWLVSQRTKRRLAAGGRWTPRGRRVTSTLTDQQAAQAQTRLVGDQSNGYGALF